MNPLPLRLHPGDDLCRALEDTVRTNGCRAAFAIAGIGSPRTTRLRLAGAAEPVTIDGDVEILTLSGSIDETGSHLHVGVADATGRVTGGHAAHGCIVRTTAEILIALRPDWRFTREVDPTTGYAELVAASDAGGPSSRTGRR